MRSKIFITVSVSLLPLTTVVAQSVYCPQHSGYVSTGMTEEQVLSACGQPLSKQPSKATPKLKVPVKQLIYSTLNSGAIYPGLNSAFYNQWSLPSGSTGTSLEVDIIDNKVSGVLINGSSTNAMSICHGMSVQIGDNVTKVYNACGSPATVNNTFINQTIPSNSKPEVWIYQVNQYQPPISLTFINGKLQFIE